MFSCDLVTTIASKKQHLLFCGVWSCKTLFMWTFPLNEIYTRRNISIHDQRFAGFFARQKQRCREPYPQSYLCLLLKCQSLLLRILNAWNKRSVCSNPSSKSGKTSIRIHVSHVSVFWLLGSLTAQEWCMILGFFANETWTPNLTMLLMTTDHE